MPNKLTDTEIKKALECCSEPYCNDNQCPLHKNTINTKDCITQLSTNALDLINRLEGEKEKNENIIRIADKTIATLDAENESLKAEVERLRDNNNLLTEAGQEWQRRYKTAKAEAYKEFAELIKEQMRREYYSEYAVDRILNGLVGDNK